jgi:hypothetical protein
MCDYSLEAYKSRAAVDGEDLVIKQFPSGSKGFVENWAARGLRDVPIFDCAVCCKDGVEMVLLLDATYNVREVPTQYVDRKNVELHGEIPVTFHTLARGDLPKTTWGIVPHNYGYRDGFIIPGGHFLSVQDLPAGTRATVTKALPKELSEAVKGDVAFEEENRIADVAPLATALID